MTNKKMLRKLGAASFIMMASVFASRLIGVFRAVAIADVGGVQAGVDAYQIAFIIPEILNHIVASGFLSITFIPIFTQYLACGKKKQGYHVFSIILNSFGLLLIMFMTATMIWTPWFVRIAAPGLRDPVTFALAVKMTRIILPAQFFFFVGGLLMAVQFANEKFFIPALAPLVYNLGIIAGGLLLGSRIGMEGFAWGVLAGAFMGNFVLQIMGARSLGVKYYPVFSIKHPDLIKYTKLTLPLMLGLTMTFSTEILLKFFGSYLSEGNIAAMNYSVRIMFILVGLFGQAIGVASYPFMAKLAARDDRNELNQLVNKTVKFIFMILPFSILFMVLSHEIVLILFQRGKFDADATAMTASILPFFMAGAFAFSATSIISRGYYAIQNTIFPAVFTSICVISSLPAIFFLMKIMGAKGVALGLSLSAMIQSFLLFEFWSKKNNNLHKKEVHAFFMKIVFISLVMGGIIYVSADGLRTFIDPSGFTGALTISVLTGTEFLICFFISGHILKIQEILTLYHTIYKKIIPA
jgi:putative peptidoglycan lipid II flippase